MREPCRKLIGQILHFLEICRELRYSFRIGMCTGQRKMSTLHIEEIKLGFCGKLTFGGEHQKL